ncbi:MULTISPECIES: pilus assembly protein CpaE [unclassified Sphingomonas]|jgi:pilus assembly protein CpaE|uniref:AAA family ATPase n=1 Tax=unclassified Sphingomonas TaxID=196159 RepID=UPI00226AEF8A|nr:MULTISPECIES: pilus assembly protein CpaE [unclassified Sphingomonas]
MNAPWKPAGSGLRDPFAAYVCDETTLETLRPIATELGWSVDKIYKGGLRNAVQSLSVSASPQILFVDLAESGDPLNDINALAEVCEPGTVVIAAGQVNDVRLYRDLVASGIQDYLLKPLHPDMLREAFGHAQAMLNAPKLAEAVIDRPHASTAVIGTRGGVGASTIATSLAWLMSEREKRTTALLDLDVHFGTAALALDLEPGRGLTDAIENPSRIDGLFIERAMVKASEKLAVLSAEAPINAPLMTDGSAFFQLQEEMRAAFECTVVDLPRGMLVQHPHLISDIQCAVVVTELTLAAARDTIRILSWLKTNAPQTQVIVAANRLHATGQLEISRKDFEGSIERRIDFVVPFDQKLAAQAAKLGKPMAEAGKNSKTIAPLIEMLGRVLYVAEESSSDTKGAAKGSTKGKSLISSLMAKRAKK